MFYSIKCCAQVDNNSTEMRNIKAVLSLLPFVRTTFIVKDVLNDQNIVQF